MPKFILEIDLGNEAMNCGYDIAETLKKISDHIYGNGLNPFEPSETKLRDINGNLVGKYEVTE